MNGCIELYNEYIILKHVLNVKQILWARKVVRDACPIY